MAVSGFLKNGVSFSFCVKVISKPSVAKQVGQLFFKGAVCSVWVLGVIINFRSLMKFPSWCLRQERFSILLFFLCGIPQLYALLMTSPIPNRVFLLCGLD